MVRNIKLKKVFGESDTDFYDKFLLKSQFVSNIIDHPIQTFEKVLLRDIKDLETEQQKLFFNLSRVKREILKGITSDSSLIFKEAEKGRALAILNKTDYMQELNMQLYMEEFYLPIPNDPTSHMMNILRVVLQEASNLNCINERTAAFLLKSISKSTCDEHSS